jgi:hypothetical protein
MLKTKVKSQWMVIARHFGMPGGLFDYGEASIEDFFDNFDDACKYAEKLLKSTEEDLVEPMIWVLKCERTYQRSKEGLCYAYS